MNQLDDKPKFAFKFNWKITLFTLLLLPLLVGLGFWQLQRAQEKQTIQEEYQRQQALAPVGLEEVGAEEGNYRRVRLTGKYITDRYWLLENKIQNGRTGYHIVMAFENRDGMRVVVDRGWVAAKSYREELPEFSTPEGTLSISGTLVQPADSPFIDESQNPVIGWPHRLLELDLGVMQSQLGGQVFSSVLQIDADSPGALAIDWRQINMTPEKHRAYAVQWFALAIVLVVLFLYANSNIAQVFNRNRKQ